MATERFEIDIVGNARRAAATAFAQVLAERLKARGDGDPFFVIRDQTQIFLAEYEAGLENLAKQWQRIANNAINCQPLVYRNRNPQNKGE